MLYKDFMQGRTECPFCHPERQEQLLKTKHAFLTYSLAPYTKHHLMVVPNRHMESVTQMTDEEMFEVHTLERKALAILKKLGHDNATLLVREGMSSGKTIPHIHFHIIPKVLIGNLESDSRERHIMTPEEVNQTIADIKKSL